MPVTVPFGQRLSRRAMLPPPPQPMSRIWLSSLINTLVVTGTASESDIRKAVEQAGFEFKGKKNDQAVEGLGLQIFFATVTNVTIRFLFGDYFCVIKPKKGKRQ